MKTPLGTEVDIGAGHIILDGFPALRERGTAPPPSYILATVAHLATAELVYLFVGIVVEAHTHTSFATQNICKKRGNVLAVSGNMEANFYSTSALKVGVPSKFEKNSPGDEIAKVNFLKTTSYM